jgi:chromosome segregation ATPase
MSEAELKTDIELAKRDISGMQSMMSKLDTAIDKIADVSNGISKILAVHDQTIDTLKVSVEERKRLSEREVELLHKRISEMKDENTEERKANQTELLAAIKEMDRSNKTDIEGLSERVAVLEKWKWAVIVGATVAGFFLSKMPMFADLFT